VAALLLALAAVLAVLELTNTTHLFHKNSPTKPAVSAGQSTKGEKTATTNSSQQNSGTPASTPSGSANTSQPGDTKSNTVTTADLITPFGNFVSAHANVPSSTALSSVCNTTVGATCKIAFTSGTLTRYLSSETTDSGGSAYWPSWTPNSIGLTPGTWQVSAVATLNGQTKTGTDATNLEIKP